MKKLVVTIIMISILLGGCGSSTTQKQVQTSSQSQTFEDNYKKGTNAYEAKRYDEALSYLTKITQADPNYKDAQTIIQIINLEQKQKQRLQAATDLVNDYKNSAGAQIQGQQSPVGQSQAQNSTSNTSQANDINNELVFSDFNRIPFDEGVFQIRLRVKNMSNSSKNLNLDDFAVRKDGNNVVKPGYIGTKGGFKDSYNVWDEYSVTLYQGDIAEVQLYFHAGDKSPEGYKLYYINNGVLSPICNLK